LLHLIVLPLPPGFDRVDDSCSPGGSVVPAPANLRRRLLNVKKYLLIIDKYSLSGDADLAARGPLQPVKAPKNKVKRPPGRGRKAVASPK
jgi:hypothetical protein